MNILDIRKGIPDNISTIIKEGIEKYHSNFGLLIHPYQLNEIGDIFNQNNIGLYYQYHNYDYLVYPRFNDSSDALITNGKDNRIIKCKGNNQYLVMDIELPHETIRKHNIQYHDCIYSKDNLRFKLKSNSNYYYIVSIENIDFEILNSPTVKSMLEDFTIDLGSSSAYLCNKENLLEFADYIENCTGRYEWPPYKLHSGIYVEPYGNDYLISCRGFFSSDFNNRPSDRISDHDILARKDTTYVIVEKYTNRYFIEKVVDTPSNPM